MPCDGPRQIPRQNQNRRSRGHETLWFNSELRIPNSEMRLLTSSPTAFAPQNPPAAKWWGLFKRNNFNVFGQNLFWGDGYPSPCVVSIGQTPESFTLNQNSLADGRQLDFITFRDIWHKSDYMLPSQTNTRRFLADGHHRASGGQRTALPTCNGRRVPTIWELAGGSVMKPHPVHFFNPV